MQKHNLSPDEALGLVKNFRRCAGPNQGFMEQLELYYQMKCPTDVERHQIYQDWLASENMNKPAEVVI
jgi:dual specificity phosphatase 12